MTGAALASLLKLVDTGRDNALLRFSLGNEYLKSGDAASAVTHLSVAVERDPQYSAAWKLLGKAHEACDELPEALAAYRQGIAVAERKGDQQALREMTVFAKRLERRLEGAA
jgi:Tfp pilus assembly protein PilF